MLQPKYEYDTEVRVVKNIKNDSWSMGRRKGELLVRRGTTGYVRQSGVFQQDKIIYQVHFLESNQIIGCREAELILASIPWIQNRFESGDKVKLSFNLQHNGSSIASKSDNLEILGMDRTDPEDILYRVQIQDIEFEVPERALQPA